MDMIGFLPGVGGLVWTLISTIVALSIIVAVHEYGHYIVGRWTGIHAEVFSLGFGKVLVSRVDRFGTRWQIAALPFGGYVKFLGDSNAASGKDGVTIDAMSDAERRHTMHGAPLWARAATVAAGPMFNFIMAIVILFFMVIYNGIATQEAIVGSVKALPGPGETLHVGDKILSINGQETPDLAAVFEVSRALDPAPTVAFEIERDGQQMTIDGAFPFPAYVESVTPTSAGDEAGILPGDVIVAVDGTRIFSFDELATLARGSDGRAMTLTIWRAGSEFDLTLTPRRSDLPKPDGTFETRWLIGLQGSIGFGPQTRVPGVLEAAEIAVVQTWTAITTNLNALYYIATGEISLCNMRSPVGIAEAAGAAASQGAESFLLLLIGLSVGVGLLNLFPIPILDGGHLVFHAWEAITGRPPGGQALQVMMTFGLAIIFGLMALVFLNETLFCG